MAYRRQEGKKARGQVGKTVRRIDIFFLPFFRLFRFKKVKCSPRRRKVRKGCSLRHLRVRSLSRLSGASLRSWLERNFILR